MLPNEAKVVTLAKNWRGVWRRAFSKNRGRFFVAKVFSEIFLRHFFSRNFFARNFFSESFLEDRVEILCFELSVAARAEGDEVRRVVAATVSRGDDVVDGEVAGTAAVDALVSVSLSDLTSGLLPVVAVELGAAGA
jgi:hypothetical protein